MRDGLAPPGSTPDDPTDDELRRALRDMAAAASTQPVGEPTEIRRVARRRQVTAAVATAAAVVLIATSAVVAAPTLLEAGPPADRPSTPAPTETETQAVEDAPAPPPSPTPEATPSSSPPSPPAVSSPPPSTPVTPPTEIPADYRLPSEQNDWQWEEVAYWPFPACDRGWLGGRPAGASDMRARMLPQLEPNQYEAVAVYPSADAAVAAMGALREAVDRCGSQPDQIIERAELPGPWGDGFVRFSGSSTVGGPDPSQARAFQHVYVVRVGNAIGLTYNSYFGEVTSHEATPANIAANREPIDELAPTLCVFTAAGC